MRGEAKRTHDNPAEAVVHIAAPLLRLPLRLRFARAFDDDAFCDFCANHRDLRIERSAEGEITIMLSTGGVYG